jgi:hypothetical protein
MKNDSLNLAEVEISPRGIGHKKVFLLNFEAGNLPSNLTILKYVVSIKSLLYTYWVFSLICC